MNRVPFGKVAVKIGIIKNTVHFHHVRHVPNADVAIELAMGKQEFHIPDARDIPIFNVAVKLGVRKHVVHADNFGNIPFADVSIELGMTEHVIHALHVRNIPFADIAIEWGSIKQSPHVCNLRGVDVIQVAFITEYVHCAQNQGFQMASVQCGDFSLEFQWTASFALAGAPRTSRYYIVIKLGNVKCFFIYTNSAEACLRIGKQHGHALVQ